jgi:mannosyltransferase
MLGAIAATLALSWAVEDRTSTRRWLVYGVVAAVASYFQLFVWFVLAGHALTLVLRRMWPTARALAFGVTAFLVLVSPLLFFITRGYSNVDWIQRPELGDVRVALTRIVFGGTSLFVLGAFVALWLWGVYCARNDKRELLAITLAACWFATPFALALLVSAWKPLFVARYLLVCVPAAVLLAAAGIDAIARRSRAVAGVGLIAILLCNGAVLRDWYRGQPAKEDFRRAVAAACHEAGDTGSVFVVPYSEPAPTYYETAKCGIPNSDTRHVVVTRTVYAAPKDDDGWTTTSRREFTGVTVYVRAKA